MSAAATPPAPSPPATPSAATGPGATAPPPAVPLRAGEQRDVGTARWDSVAVERWTVHGTAKVTGEVRTLRSDLQGPVTIGGRFSTDQLVTRGTVDVEGAVEVRESLHGSGSFRASQNLHAGEVAWKGTMRTLGGLSVDRTLSVRGALNVPSLRAGAATIEGAVEVSSDAIVAFDFSARLDADSTLGTVRARSVVLRARIPNLFEKILGKRLSVTVRRVEAEAVELEGVDVAFVRAPQIRLGRESHVTEYEGTIVERHASARVGFESKSPPPYGLRR